MVYGCQMASLALEWKFYHLYISSTEGAYDVFVNWMSETNEGAGATFRSHWRYQPTTIHKSPRENPVLNIYFLDKEIASMVKTLLVVAIVVFGGRL